jgi:hypothetical protein
MPQNILHFSRTVHVFLDVGELDPHRRWGRLFHTARRGRVVLSRCGIVAHVSAPYWNHDTSHIRNTLVPADEQLTFHEVPDRPPGSTRLPWWAWLIGLALGVVVAMSLLRLRRRVRG